MADNTKIGPIFRGANGGLSDDLFTGIKNSFYFSNDMEIRTDAKSIFPKPVPAYADATKRAGISITSLTAPSCVLYSSDDNGRLVGVGRYIYKVSGTTSTLLCSLPNRICDMEIFNGYFYVSTETYVYYKIINGSDHWSDMEAATDNTEVYYGRCVDTLTSTSYHPLYGSDVCLCVGDANKVRKITKEVYDTLQDGFATQTNFKIRFIDEMGGYVRVSAVDEPYGSQILLWNKVDNVATEVIPLEGHSIFQSAIYNGYHYILTNKGLGLINGYQLYMLKKADGEIKTASMYAKGMCVYDDKLYFVANDGIYIYGAKNKNYADVLGLWHKVEDGYFLGAIGAYKNGIMVTRGAKSAGGGSREPCYVGINEGVASTGEIQTMCYFGTSMSEIKQSMYLRVGYHLGKEGANSGDIHIYYRTEADAIDDNPENWQWHPVQPNDEGLKATSDMRSPFATTLKLNCRFQWIQFKFVLTNCQWVDGGNTLTKDTNLYSADLYYNTMLD